MSSNFQYQLKEDIKATKKSEKIFAFADKIANIYQIEKDGYNKLTTNAITSTYKKVLDKINNKVNEDGKKIIENKEVVSRMFVNSYHFKRPQTDFFKQPQSSLTKFSQKQTQHNQLIHIR